MIDEDLDTQFVDDQPKVRKIANVTFWKSCRLGS